MVRPPGCVSGGVPWEVLELALALFVNRQPSRGVFPAAARWVDPPPSPPPPLGWPRLAKNGREGNLAKIKENEENGHTWGP